MFLKNFMLIQLSNGDNDGNAVPLIVVVLTALRAVQLTPPTGQWRTRPLAAVTHATGAHQIRSILSTVVGSKHPERQPQQNVMALWFPRKRRRHRWVGFISGSTSRAPWVARPVAPQVARPVARLAAQQPPESDREAVLGHT